MTDLKPHTKVIEPRGYEGMDPLQIFRGEIGFYFCYNSELEETDD